MSQQWSLRSTLFGAACTAASPLLLNALSIPAMAYIIRKLGPTAYGEWTVATSLVGTVAILASLGLRGAFIRAVAREPEKAPVALAEQLGTRLLLSLVAISAAIGLCAALRYSPTILACTTITGVGLILTTASTSAADLLQALHRLPAVAAVNFFAGFLLTAVSVLAMWLGVGPVGLSVTYLIGPIISVASLWLLVQRQHFPVRINWSLSRAKVLFVESRHFVAQSAINVVSAQAAALMLPKLIGTTSFGFYAAGTLLATRLVVIPDALAGAFYPTIASSYRSGPAAAGHRMLQYLSFVQLACLPIAILVASFAGPISHILFPAREATCYQIIRITIWVLPLMGYEYLVGCALNAAGQDAAKVRIAIFTSSLHILSTVALVLSFGIVGACWALVLRPVIGGCLMTPLFLRTFLIGAARHGLTSPQRVPEVGGR